MQKFISFLLIFDFSSPIWARSVNRETPTGPPVDEPIDTGLFYDAYLQEVIKVLEKDDEFRKKMENVNFEDVKIATFSKELNNVAKHVRDELDNLKRKEVDRIRKLLKAKARMDEGKPVNHKQLIENVAGHIDHFNPNNFQAKDLENLIQSATKDLENYDEKRHEQFKQYEMEKAVEREEKLKNMNEYERAKAMEEEKKRRERHNKHEKIPHPFSQKFILDVWNKFDHLKGEKFDAKTFFMMHDVNGDRYIDAYELEAIFQAELDKVYDPENPDDDIREMEEERARMREHVMKEVDTDRNGAISLQEFLDYTNSMEFTKPTNEYHMIDELIDSGEIYTSEELQTYKIQVQQHEEVLKQKLAALRQEAVNLAQQKKDFVVAKAKASELNDPQINQVIKKTENDLNHRELQLMQAHQNTMEHGKQTLELKQDLAKKQVDAYLAHANMTEYEEKYNKLKADAEAMLKNKENEYAAQIAQAQESMKKAQEEVHKKLQAQQEEMAKKLEQMKEEARAEARAEKAAQEANQL